MITKKRISKGYWIWGQFGEESTDKLRKIKKIVSDELGGPSFSLHITLSGPLPSINSDMYESIKKIASSTNRFNVETKSFKSTNVYFESLFIKIIKSKELLSIKERIDNRFGITPGDYSPHVSLFYGIKNPSKKDNVIRFLPKLPKQLLLDKISIVKVDEEIETWTILEQFMLFKGISH